MSYASFCDLKTKEVSNWVWLFYGSTSLIVSAVTFSTQAPTAMIFYVINVAVTFIVAFAMWELNVFGGADTKALVCISFAHVTSLLVFGYTMLLMFGANMQKKKENLALIPFMTLALAIAFLNVIALTR